MNRRELLLAGSFKGVPFNFIESSTSNGRRVEIDQFINSNDIRYEDLGKDLKVFDIKIRLSALGQEYYSRRDALESVLWEEGEGELVHPMRGKFNVIVKGRPKTSEDIPSLGMAEISVKFIAVDGIRKGLSFSLIKSVESLAGIADEIARNKVEQFSGIKLEETDFGALVTKIKGGYGLNFIDSAKQAQSFVTGLSSKFKFAKDLIENPLKAGEFAAQLLGFENGTVTSAAELASDTYMLFYNANNFIESAKDRYSFFTELFGFGDDDPEIPQTTRSRVEQSNNQILQRSIIQTTALVHATTASTEIDYSTDVELSANSDIIQEQFLKVMSADGTTSDNYNSLQQIRVDFTTITKDLILNVSRIIEIETNNIGLSTLIYQYYGLGEGFDGYDTIYDLIVGLNNFEETGSIYGTIKIITERGA